jgi:hypothetical protein
MPAAHSKYSASGFEAVMLCPGKPVMEHGRPNRSSVYADWGTDAHELAAMCLEGLDEEAQDPASYKGRKLPLGNDVDDEMVACVSTYVRNAREIVGDGMLLAEQRVCYAHWLDVPEDEAWGTADVIGLRGDELQVHDLKTGQGVEVDADNNPQMKLYALGALAVLRAMGEEPETVRLVIHQPRIRQAPSEWTCSVADLEAWGYGAARSAVNSRRNAEQDKQRDQGWEDVYLRPAEKACKFCKAKASCPALRADVASTVSDAGVPAEPEEFEAMPAATVEGQPARWLAACLVKVDMIEDWCKAVRAEVERCLLAGQPVPGFKLVQGKQGNRAWSDPAAAEKMLREQFRLKVEDAYDLKLISPTSAEKLAKAGTIGPRQWKAAEALIVRAAGKPHVAPESDKRPALSVTPTADDFEAVTPTDSDAALA